MPVSSLAAEALALRASQAQEAQEALQMKLQAEANLEILRNDCAAQASRLLELEDAKVSKDQLVERLKHRCHQAKVKRESFHHYQAKDLHRQVIFHAWLSVSRQNLALEAKKNAGAHMALQILAALARHRLSDALQCWRGKAMARAVEVASQRSLAEQYEAQREVRVQHGVSILDHLMRRRLQQALLGHWRVLRWQHMVRSLDSSFARDQRRMLAETDSLRSQLLQSHDEALELRALKASEANKALRTQQEAEAIVEAVKKERANQAAKLQDMEASKNAMEQLCSKLRDQLDQAMSEVSQLENEKRNAMQQLCSLQSDLDDAQRQREEMSQAEMQRERAFQEQVQALQQRALNREAELQDAAQRSEKTLEQKLHEKQRAVELQTSIAEDQEKNIRHLEDLLKEQGNVLARERNDHQRGLNALRASASLSESKTSLLQEQVVALRQQLQREHQELMASERAWSSDHGHGRHGRGCKAQFQCPAEALTGVAQTRKHSMPLARSTWLQKTGARLDVRSAYRSPMLVAQNPISLPEILPPPMADKIVFSLCQPLAPELPATRRGFPRRVTWPRAPVAQWAMSAKDLVLRVLVVVTILWAAQVLKDGYKEIQERRLKNPDAAKVNVMDDVFLGVICFVGMLVAQLLFRQLFAVVARAMIPKKPRWSHTVWGAKVTRCCDSIFKCAYYCAMTAWCFALLKDEPWLPRLLGGRGATKACWTNYPFQEVSADLRRFYLTAVGYHCSEVVLLLLEVRHPDFWEMMLHHLVTCCLVLFSFGLNYLRVGSLVLLLHGITDIFINLSKALVDTSNTRLIVASYFALLVSYVWPCRRVLTSTSWGSCPGEILVNWDLLGIYWHITEIL
eukprot:s62_g1.t1